MSVSKTLDSRLRAVGYVAAQGTADGISFRKSFMERIVGGFVP